MLKVKRLVAVCFLEAAKTTLEHLATYRLSLSQEGSSGPPELPRVYADVRRLRDYLLRCANGRQDEIELDMADDDQRLLVACCRRSVEVIDLGLFGPRQLGADEAILLRKKRQVIAHWAVELATHPLLELPLSQLSAAHPQGARALHVRLQQKVKGDKQEQEKAAESAKVPDPTKESEPTTAAEIEEMNKVHLAAEPAVVVIDEPGQRPGEVETPAPAALTSLLDCNRVQDPRLRSLITQDLASYACCMAAGDHRLAEVMLASVMESALLDHVLPQRTKLGLSGPPETWNLKQLMIRVMGQQCTSRDRTLIGHLFSARTLLRPAVQMVAPMPVSLDSFEALRDLVQRVMTDLRLTEDSCATAAPSRDADENGPAAT